MSEASILHKAKRPWYILLSDKYFYHQNTDEESLHSDSLIHNTKKKWYWHSCVGRNNALDSQAKSTCGNDFQMPEENVSNSNPESTFTHASKVLQELSHLFSDF